MPNTVKITLHRVGPRKMEAINQHGRTLVMDAPVAAGGSDDGVRPIEALLMSLAGCSATDVMAILEKRKQNPDYFAVLVDGTRKDATPAVFEEIRIHFELKGNVNQADLDDAIKLSAEKFCSVGAMLAAGGVKLVWKGTVDSSNSMENVG